MDAWEATCAEGLEDGEARKGTLGLRTDTEMGLAAEDVFLSDSFHGAVELRACGGDSEPVLGVWASILRRCRCDGFWNDRGEVKLDVSSFSALAILGPDGGGRVRVTLAVAVSAIIAFMSTLRENDMNYWILDVEYDLLRCSMR